MGIQDGSPNQVEKAPTIAAVGSSDSRAFVSTFVSVQDALDAARRLAFEADGNHCVANHRLGFPLNEVVLRYEGPLPTCGVPTVCAWGAVAMTLLLLTAGTVMVARRRQPVD